MNIAQAILVQFPNADPLIDFRVQDDSNGKGPYIAYWNIKDSSGNIVPEPSSADLESWNLEASQHAKIAELYAGLKLTLSGGFKSKSTSHSYETDTSGQVNVMGDLKRLELDTTLTSVQFFTTDTAWIAHTEAQLQSVFLDGGKWKDAQYAQLGTLEANAKAATVDTLPAIQWREAAY